MKKKFVTTLIYNEYDFLNNNFDKNSEYIIDFSSYKIVDQINLEFV